MIPFLIAVVSLKYISDFHYGPYIFDISIQGFPNMHILIIKKVKSYNKLPSKQKKRVKMKLF